MTFNPAIMVGALARNGSTDPIRSPSTAAHTCAARVG
jgi:hypothetical protein